MNVKADANCTAVKRGVRSRVRMLLPRRKSWRLCYDGVEMVGVPRKELREKMRTESIDVPEYHSEKNIPAQITNTKRVIRSQNASLGRQRCWELVVAGLVARVGKDRAHA